MAGMILKGQRVVVIGANASGLGLVKFLVKRNAQVKLVDACNPDVVMPWLQENADLTKFSIEFGEFNPAAFTDTQLIVVTPGTRVDVKILEFARSAGIPVWSELEFASQYIEEPIIAVAGTNGKSTTAHLLARMIQAQGKTVFTNNGVALSSYLNQSKAADYVVVVANSYQLEGTSSFKPSMILLLNLSEDHLNRYVTLDAYYAANREVLRNCDASTTVILNGQDALVSALVPALAGPTFLFSSEPIPTTSSGAWFGKNQLVVRLKPEAQETVFSLTSFKMRGTHNRENLCAAVLAAMNLGLSAAKIQTVIDEVRPLADRVEFVQRLNSVAFYNDASGANVNATVRTLQAFNEPVILISGGRDKNQDYSPLAPHVRQRTKNLILIGEAKEKINRAIGDYTETFLVGTVEEALLLAYQKSRSGDVVLFSPGCDPTDAFTDHAAKGDFFRKLVTQLAQPRRPTVI